MDTLILSDVHLGSKHCQTHRLLDVLDREPFDRLILNGDTLHSLHLGKMRDEHWELLTRFRDLAREREVILIRGNHDHDWHGDRVRQAMHAARANGNGSARGGVAVVAAPPVSPSMEVLPALLGVPMLEEYRLDVGGQPYVVTHGDHFDPALESELPRHVAGWCYQVSRKLSKKLAKWLKKRSAAWSGAMEHIRQSAAAFARAHDCAGVIIGHTHHADDLDIDGTHFVNTGCWTEPPYAFVTVADGRLTLHQSHD
jgi:UDP-2,3-diacylglucosamine pyrophosphatase LpxH